MKTHTKVDAVVGLMNDEWTRLVGITGSWLIPDGAEVQPLSTLLASNPTPCHQVRCFIELTISSVTYNNTIK